MKMLSAKRKSSVCCAECREEIRAGKDWVRLAGQQVYHVTCFACSQCGVQFANGALFILRNGRPVCQMHFSDSPEQQAGRVAARRVKRTRTQFTEQQYRALQRYFRDGTNPDGRRLQTIASELGLVKRHVQVWFQNNRARQKKLAESRHG
ncbi:hypothetical protein V1264_006263 [Littorina saxatilis]|uniref:Uncharacterized protein n=1 Tax=Littorina saxatilis TaxID=31220 RepID=A0AAN9G4P9_9CAEN